MLFFLMILAIPFLSLDGGFIGAAYAQPADVEAEEEIERGDDETVLLSHDKNSSSGKVSKASAKNDAKQAKALKTDLKLNEMSFNERLRRDFAEMRMIQLANNIAHDLGVVVNISIPR